MTPFQFRLQSLLQLRHAKRDECREALGRAEDTASQLEARVRQVQRELDVLGAIGRAAAEPGSLRTERLLRTHQHACRLQEQLDRLTKAFQESLQRIDQCRHALLEANRELKILDNLKQRRYEQHLRTTQQEEIRELDEIAQRLNRY